MGHINNNIIFKNKSNMIYMSSSFFYKVFNDLNSWFQYACFQRDSQEKFMLCRKHVLCDFNEWGNDVQTIGLFSSQWAKCYAHKKQRQPCRKGLHYV